MRTSSGKSRESRSRYECADRGICHARPLCLRNHKVVSSEVRLGELREKLTRKLRFSAESAHESISILRRRVHIVDPAPLPVPASRDPDDDWVLATAVAGNAEIIVTGDQDLLVLERYQSTIIRSPREFSRAEGLA